MRRFELYVGNNDRLVLSEFKDIEAEYESRIFKGKETFEIIKRLASSKLVDFSELRRGNDLILEYKNYIVNVSDYRDVFKKNGLGPLLKNIKDFEEKTILSVNKNKRVKRNNKHAGRKVVAAGLTILMLYAVGNNLIKKEEKFAEAFTLDTYSTVVEINEPETINLSKKIKLREAEKKTLSYDNEAVNISINYEDRSSANKAFITKSYYSDMITKYAKMYGVDPNLAIAIATQESKTGIHTTVTDPGGATGLMQIQNEVWIGENVSAYNFETKSMESFEVTLSKIQDVEYNIKIGCMILQNAMEYMNYNTLAGIQCYNMGYGNMSNILKAYSNNTGKSVDSILSDVSDTGWMEYRKIIPKGDPEYIEEVVSWMGDEVNIKNIKRDGSLVSITVGNQIENKKVY